MLGHNKVLAWQNKVEKIGPLELEPVSVDDTFQSPLIRTDFKYLVAYDFPTLSLQLYFSHTKLY